MSVELVQTLADEISPDEEVKFSPYEIALLGSIPRMNLEIFEELRDYAGMTYDEITQDLIHANLPNLFEVYLKFTLKYQIEIDLDSALFLAIAKHRQRIVSQLITEDTTKFREAFVVACQYDNLYWADYLLKHDMVNIDEVYTWVEQSGNIEVLNLIQEMIIKIAHP